ncbi:MAG: NAD(P)/FAD-dependent oxidoreductase [Gemmatimonadota bacterium]
MRRPRVIIVGAGFGGLACSRSLAKAPVHVVLIDRNNYHLFTPLLYQVASSLLNPSDIVFPVRQVFRRSSHIEFVYGEVMGVDLAGQVVRLSDHRTILYDFLVLATGSQTNFYGMESVERLAYGLKDLSEALELRNHVLRCFENATAAGLAPDRQRWLTFVVVGGGPTGVEYAGALSELVHLELSRDFPALDMRQVRIVLVEGEDRVLPAFAESLGMDTSRRLQERYGIEVRVGERVTEAESGSVCLAGGGRIEAETLVWAAGVRPSELASHVDSPTSRSGRLSVSESLRLPGQDRVYAIGDLAAADHEGGEAPMLSAPAIQAGRTVARSIRRQLKGEKPVPFAYRDKGIMATIGRSNAVAQVGRFRLKGFPGWIAWLAVHLYYILGVRNRIAVLSGWAWNYLFRDRPIRLIARARARETPADR